MGIHVTWGCLFVPEQPSKKQAAMNFTQTLQVSQALPMIPGIPTTIKTMGVNITTIAYLRVLIIEIGSTTVLMVVEAQGDQYQSDVVWFHLQGAKQHLTARPWTWMVGILSRFRLGC